MNNGLLTPVVARTPIIVRLTVNRTGTVPLYLCRHPFPPQFFHYKTCFRVSKQNSSPFFPPDAGGTGHRSDCAGRGDEALSGRSGKATAARIFT